jgi:hypothetical protein
MKLLLLLLILNLFICITALSQTSKESAIVGYWYYSDDYTTKQLILKDNLKFYWYYSSCEGSDCYTGNFEVHGDSLVLHIKKSKSTIEFLIRNNKIFTYKGKENNYPDFEPLSLVDKQKKLKCTDIDIEIVEFDE